MLTLPRIAGILLPQEQQEQQEQQDTGTLYKYVMDVKALITTASDILSGQPVCAGTRVPVETLFDHLEAGVPLAEFLNDFPTVSREQAVAVLGELIVKLIL